MKLIYRTRVRPIRMTGVLLLTVLALALLPGGSISALSAAPPTAEGLFAAPLGFRDGVTYAPRVMHDGDQLIEDTNYAVQNPDLKGITCFGVAWEKIWHAGQDLYRTDGQSTAGAEVTAIADGTVAYANPNMNYPGLVVIVEHALADGETLYSVYAHLDDNSLEVTQGEEVAQGQKLGTVLKQRYSGRFPELHPSGDDSHLHFEVRKFLNGARIYTAAPACNGLIVGRGYTYPALPDDFPAEGKGYVDPEGLSAP